MKVLLLCTFSGLLSFEACSSIGLAASLISSPFAEIGTRCIRKQRIGYAPVPTSVPRLPSSVDPDWEVWPTCWITRQSFRMRTSLTSHGAQVSATQGHQQPLHRQHAAASQRDHSNQRAPLWRWSADQSPSGEVHVYSKKTQRISVL